MLWDKYFGGSLAGEKRHCDGSLVGGVAVSRVSCTSNSAIAAMTPKPGERPVGPAAVQGRPRSNKSTMATTLVSGQLNMTQKLLAGFEQLIQLLHQGRHRRTAGRWPARRQVRRLPAGHWRWGKAGGAGI